MKRGLHAVAAATAVALVGGCAGELESDSSAGGAAGSAAAQTGAAVSSGATGATASSTAGGAEEPLHVPWLRRWGAKKTSEKINAIVVEPDDAVVVTGTIGTFDVGPSPLVSVDAEDILLARFDANGELVTARMLAGPSQNGPRALGRRDDGTLTMLGVFGDTFPAFEPALTTFGGPSVFVGALAANFESLWGRAFVGAATGRGQTTMATTDAGAVVVAGTFHETLVTREDVIASTGPSDAYVTRLSANGELDWMLTLGGPEVAHLEIGASVADGEEVVVAGQLRGTLRTAAGVELARSDDVARAFLIRFDDQGRILAVRMQRSTGSSAVIKLVRRPEGLLAAVTHGGSLATAAGDVTSAGEGDATLLWLDGAGAPLFGKTWGDQRSQQIVGLDVDAAGRILASGSFLGGIDFGDGFHKTSDGRPDGFAVALSPTGLAERTVIAGDAIPADGKKRGSQGTSAVAWLSNGDAIVAGNFTSTLVLGDASAKSAGTLDAFLARVELTR